MLPARAPSSPDQPGENPALLGPALTAQVELTGEAYDLAYDADRNLLWLAVMHASGPAELIAVDAETMATTRWPLPDADYGGFLSRVKIGDDASIWITQPWRIARFDPESEALITKEFEVNPDDALPGALDPGNPLPGTWISGIAIDGSGIVVARNNVPHLIALDAGLAEIARIPVHRAYAGAQDLAVSDAGEVWALSHPTEPRSVGLFTRDGELIAEYSGGGTRIESADGRAVALGFATGATLLESTEPVPVGIALGLSDASRVAVSGTTTVVYDAGTGTINLFAGASLAGRLELGEVAVEIVAPGPEGGVADAVIRPRINDVALDRDGRTWYLDGRAHALVRLTW